LCALLLDPTLTHPHATLVTESFVDYGVRSFRKAKQRHHKGLHYRERILRRVVDSVFQCVDLTKDFLGLTAINRVSLQVHPGELVGLIGPNGSGKTTLFNCLTGFLKPTAGRVLWKGQDITHLPPHEIALRGITRTFQQIHVFRKLTTLENLVLAVQQHQGERIIPSILRTPSIRQLERETLERAHELLKFADMSHVKDEKAGNLSYGQQKILSFLTTLMPSPSLVLLDEPGAR
jgi:ABC-type branched-subunit amino acid transport system ATPase component